MITVLLLMTSGIIVGWILHHKTSFLQWISKFTNWAIYLLLFLLGLAVGSNEEILSSFDKIGYLSIAITLFAVAGSIFTAWITYQLFFKNKGGEDER
ncbi:MAG TPA: LysO family transporter [Bacteroidales bacterium]|nr:LysO family transporter [Bacteroidales bacterium]